MWSADETKKLAQMRQRLHDQLSQRRQLPDVVGDRRLLRFLRGHKTVEKATEMFTKFLKWRDDNDVDSIRDDILYGGMRSQYDLPAARKIMSLLPQTMMSAEALDLCGNPVALESFAFQPEQVLKEIPKPEYVLFMIYTLEYKTLMLDQLAYEREQALISKHQQIKKPITAPYGVMVQSDIIRDLNGFGMAHVGADGQTVMKWILEIAADNYPELLFKSHMINVPWVFNSIWWLVKNILDPNTIKKISITGTDYMTVLLKDIPITSIPTCAGGKFVPREELFVFDLTPSGPFHYPRKDQEVNIAARREHRLHVNGGNAVNNTNGSKRSIQSQAAQGVPVVLTSGALVPSSQGGVSSPYSLSKRSTASTTPATDTSSRLKNGFHPIEQHIPRMGMISTTSTEAVLLAALGQRQVKISHILKMRDPTRNRDLDLSTSFVEGRRRRARERAGGDSERERIPAADLQGIMKPQRSCQKNCVISC